MRTLASLDIARDLDSAERSAEWRMSVIHQPADGMRDHHSVPRQYGWRLNRLAISRLLPLLALLTLSLSLADCGFFDSEPSRVALVVGSRKIPIDRLRRDITFFGLGISLAELETEEVRERLVERIIDHYLILEYGKKVGITLSDAELRAAVDAFQKDYPEGAFKEALLYGYVDFEEWRNRLAEQLLIRKVLDLVTQEVPPPSYQEISRFYDENRQRYSSARMVKFRQIVTRKKEEADALLVRLKNREDMAQLAKEHSLGPEAEKGGEVGWVEEGSLEESMEKVLFSLGVGNTSAVVSTPYGFHIFRVLDERRAGAKPLPEVMKEIEATLLQEKQEAYAERWLKGLRKDTKVEVNLDLLKELWES